MGIDGSVHATIICRDRGTRAKMAEVMANIKRLFPEDQSDSLLDHVSYSLLEDDDESRLYPIKIDVEDDRNFHFDRFILPSLFKLKKLEKQEDYWEMDLFEKDKEFKEVFEENQTSYIKHYCEELDLIIDWDGWHDTTGFTHYIFSEWGSMACEFDLCDDRDDEVRDREAEDALDTMSVLSILKGRPKDHQRTNFRRRDGYRWQRRLWNHPEDAERCPWSEIEIRADLWAQLLDVRPELASHCTCWEAFEDDDVGRLLEKHPEFRSRFSPEFLSAYEERERTRKEEESSCKAVTDDFYTEDMPF